LICWKYICPAAILGIFFASMGQMFSEFPRYEAYAYYFGNGTAITDANDLKNMVEWPGWSLAVAAILILISILWIPVVAGLRLCGVNLLAEEGPGWWPDVDLIEHYGLKDYEDSKWETMLLGHKSDGREGLLFPSVPYYVQKNGADGKGNGDDAGSKSPDANDFDDEDGNGITINVAKEPGVKFSSLVENEK